MGNLTILASNMVTMSRNMVIYTQIDANMVIPNMVMVASQYGHGCYPIWSLSNMGTNMVKHGLPFGHANMVMYAFPFGHRFCQYGHVRFPIWSPVLPIWSCRFSHLVILSIQFGHIVYPIWSYCLSNLVILSIRLNQPLNFLILFTTMAQTMISNLPQVQPAPDRCNPSTLGVLPLGVLRTFWHLHRWQDIHCHIQHCT